MKIPGELRLVAVAAAASILSACGGGGGGSTEPPLTVAKATSCATGGKPETALQGQVPAALRTSGFTGFDCNLSLVGQYRGEGGNWSSATFTDGAGKTCAYYSTASPIDRNGVRVPGRLNPGVPVINMTDPTKPVRVTSLTTPAMLEPWESLRINDRRQVLIADNGQNGGGGPEVDIYDVSGDCTSPQLLASMAVGTGLDGGVPLAKAPIGHEGNISPDGLTYYIGDLRNAAYHAVDITSTTRPKLVATYPISDLGLPGTTTHGLSVSNDGNRAYAVILGGLVGGVPGGVNTAAPNNGFAIFDTSEVQQRKPNAQMKLISKVVYADGSVAQHTIPARINGRDYLIMVDEAGSGGLQDPTAAGVKRACDAKLAPFPMARIYDIGDETKPQLVSKLMLETHDPKNCDQVIPDILGLSTFTYGSHYCALDNRDNATALACSYFNSGVRVFDIRDPARPKEIAYYNPAAGSAALPGSSHANRAQWKPGSPDWCASRLDFDFAKSRITTMCQDNGLIILQFAPNTWPFQQSTPSRNQT